MWYFKSYVNPQHIQTNSTNIKTTLSTVAIASNSIKNIGTNLNPEALAAYNAQLNGLTATQQKMALSTTNLTSLQQKQVLSYIAETAAAKSLTAQQISELSIDQKQALIKAGLITQEQIETGATLELSKAQLQKLITSEAISAKDKELVLDALGVTGANLTETTSWEVLGASIKKATAAMLKWLFLTPAGWATLAVTAIAGAIVAYNKWGDTLENNRKKLEELKSEAQTISSELQTFNGELQTTQQRISELEGKGSLTFTEAEELENLRKQNNELQRSIDLLRLKEKENNKGKNKTFVKTMQKNVDVEDERVQTGRLNPDDTAETEMITEAELIERKFNTLDELQEKLRHASTEIEKKAIQEQIDKITKYLSECNEQYIEDAKDIDYIQNPTTEDDKKVNEWLDYINDFQDKMAIAMGGDNAKENAFNRLVDNWKFDEALNPLQKLGKEGKVTLEELKKRMDDPVFVEFVNKLVEIGFVSDTTDGSLRFLASAFNGTTTSVKAYLDTLDDNESISNFINNLDDEAKALGTTKDELSKLTAGHIILNNTKLSLDDKISQIRQLGIMAGWAESKVEELILLMNRAAGNLPDSMTQAEKDARSGSAQLALYEFFGGWEQVDTNVDDEDPLYTSPDDDKDKNSPSYEDPTDAIINRINLRTKELEQQEEEIQNAIELAELEEDYEKQISLTNDLIATRKQRVEELNKANAGLHNEAEWLRNNNPWDEEKWFDSLGNATEDYYKILNSAKTKEEQEKIKELFESLSKYKKAYAENAEEIVGLNKEIIQDEKEIGNIRDKHYDSLLDDIDRYVDRIEKAREEEIDALDKQITKEEALLKIKQGEYDITNKLKESQKDIDKEIANSRNSKEYLSEFEYDKIFGDADYEFLSGEIEDITNDIAGISANFYQQIEDAYANDQLYLVEAITAEYERQLASKERELEIAKAKVDLEKKRLTLENAKNERNIKQYSENGITWVADQEKVKQATEDFIDAQATIKDLQEKSAQQMELDRRQANIDMLNSQKESIEYQNELMSKATENLKLAIEDVTDPLADLGSVIQTLIADLNADISKSAEELTEELEYSNGGGAGGGGSSGGGGGRTVNLDNYGPVIAKTDNYDGTHNYTEASNIISINGQLLDRSQTGSDGLATPIENATVVGGFDIYKPVVYDNGGFASGKGLMLKGVNEEETVLPPWLTKEILTPEYNENFSKLLENMQMVSHLNPLDSIVKPKTDSLLMKNINQPTSIAKTWTGNMYVEGGDPNEVLKAIDQAFDRITI